MKANFREWTLDKIDDTFGTKQIFDFSLLERITKFSYEISDFERHFLICFKNQFQFGGDEWNEVELENKFISPLFVLAEMSNERFSYFLERDLSVQIGDYELSGRVDGLIASGYRNPKKPYFCLHEYKRETDPSGDPKGQVLIEMLVAQALNDSDNPIFGLYIIGSKWRFVALQGKNYVFGESFAADSNDIFDIFRIIKGLKYEIEKMIA